MERDKYYKIRYEKLTLDKCLMVFISEQLIQASFFPVMYVVDFRSSIYYQKCYDPDCKGTYMGAASTSLFYGHLLLLAVRVSVLPKL